jgi:hypothetical protein
VEACRSLLVETDAIPLDLLCDLQDLVDIEDHAQQGTPFHLTLPSASGAPDAWTSGLDPV